MDRKVTVQGAGTGGPQLPRTPTERCGDRDRHLVEDAPGRPGKATAVQVPPPPVATGEPLQSRRLSPGGVLCYWLARNRLKRRRIGDVGQRAETFDRNDYARHREDELRRHFDAAFGHDQISGRDVLDLGCGTGGLSFHLAELGARSVVGIDVAPEAIGAARDRLHGLSGPVRPRFVVSEDPRRIPLPSASVDVILLFDVLEHLMDHQPVLAECRRVLRDPGRVLIWWVPWRNPWGHHIESLVPIPWVHLVVGEKDLVEACARIYDLPEFVPRAWDRVEAGGKAPNKWRRLDRLPDLNRLTRRQFEASLSAAGLRILRREIRGFGGSGLARAASSVLKRVPALGEAFTSQVVYELGTAAKYDPAHGDWRLG